MLKATQMAPTARNSGCCHPCVLRDAWAPALPAKQARADSVTECSVTVPVMGWAQAGTLPQHPAPPTAEAARRQRVTLPKSSTRTHPGAGPLPHEAGAGRPGWPRAGHTGCSRSVPLAALACLWLGEDEDFGRSQRWAQEWGQRTRLTWWPPNPSAVGWRGPRHPGLAPPV